MAKSNIRIRNKDWEKSIEKEVGNMVRKSVDRTLRIIAKNATGYGQQIINNEWYATYKPKKYERTMDMRDAFRIVEDVYKSAGGRTNIKIGYDLKKIKLNKKKHQHTSFSGHDYRKELITYHFEEAGLYIPVKAAMRGNIAYRKVHDGIHVMERVYNYINNNTDGVVTKAFKNTYDTRVTYRKSGG